MKTFNCGSSRDYRKKFQVPNLNVILIHMKPNLNYFLKERKELVMDGKRAQLFCLSSILDMTRQDTVDTPRGMDDGRRNRKKLLLSLKCHP